jgi:ketosteroid isomerase-like protein
MKAWADDAVFVYPGTTSFAGRFEGKEAVEAWFRRYMERFPRIEFTVKNVCVQEALGLSSNVVTAEWDVSVTNPEGEDFVYGGVTVIRIQKAKVVLVTDYIFDTSVLKRALGEDTERERRAS